MKIISIIILGVLFNFLSYGQTNDSYTVDPSKPESVVKAIFHAAANSDFNVLEGLCDPQNSGDDDTKMICLLSHAPVIKDSSSFYSMAISEFENDSLPFDTVKKEVQEVLTEFRPQFIEMFKKGEIVGETKYRTGVESIPDIPAATVPIQYMDPDGQVINDSVLLINREGKWYLMGI